MTARVLLKSMIKQALFEEKIEIEIRDDFDFEAVKTLDAAYRQCHSGWSSGARLKTGIQIEEQADEYGMQVWKEKEEVGGCWRGDG